MVRRNLNSDFVGGAYVFPGGAVDPSDGSEARARGLDDAGASATLGVASGGRSYYVAALRELFEEAGLLIALDDAGAPMGEDPARAASLSAGRRALNAREATFPGVLADAGVWLDLAGLAYLSHWVTPEGPPGASTRASSWSRPRRTSSRPTTRARRWPRCGSGPVTPWRRTRAATSR